MSLEIEDHLEEDPQIHGQQYFVMSYVTPHSQNEFKVPMVKVRGSYKTYQECEKRIEKLKRVDKIFNMYICEVGKWGSLVAENDLMKDDEIDVVYGEKQINQMFQQYKENSKKVEEDFEERKADLRKKATEEGQPLFQEYLKFLDEETGKDFMVPQTSTPENFDKFREKVDNIEGYMSFQQNLRSSTSEEYKKFKELEGDRSKTGDLVKDIHGYFKQYMK